jgi:hypothetical protein
LTENIRLECKCMALTYILGDTRAAIGMVIKVQALGQD